MDGTRIASETWENAIPPVHPARGTLPVPNRERERERERHYFPEREPASCLGFCPSWPYLHPEPFQFYYLLVADLQTDSPPAPISSSSPSRRVSSYCRSGLPPYPFLTIFVLFANVAFCEVGSRRGWETVLLLSCSLPSCLLPSCFRGGNHFQVSSSCPYRDARHPLSPSLCSLWRRSFIFSAYLQKSTVPFAASLPLFGAAACHLVRKEFSFLVSPPPS
ncbi:hypothetical protein VTK73DRAFT_1058 [Phialemonium thermophilum]|uniref:Transmembrane protein n=1 Tax=Phialemonium thermophilum TaxID=223376 RepID=A0ABR3VU04_9PEZI